MRAVLLLLATILCLGCHEDVVSYGEFCSELRTASRWRFVVYMDADACLTCLEDMDAWRELVAVLETDGRGEVFVYTSREDSSDVYWAMKLEGISDSVFVMDQETVEDFGWDKLGAPVKILLDADSNPQLIGGIMPSRDAARCLVNDMAKIVRNSE